MPIAFCASFDPCEKAIAQAETAGHSPLEEMLLLTTHGILHLLGFDHAEPDDGCRRRSQREFGGVGVTDDDGLAAAEIKTGEGGLVGHALRKVEDVGESVLL